MAPTWSSSEILGSARLSYPRSWAGAPVSRISASCYHCHGHAQSLTRLTGRSLPRPQAQGLYRTGSPLCDELGYLALDQQSSNLFYQVISIRHSQKRSTIITTNTPFSDWGNILFNTTIATAIADRLVENSEIFMFGGDSL